jgi:hypothetical protein
MGLYETQNRLGQSVHVIFQQKPVKSSFQQKIKFVFHFAPFFIQPLSPLLLGGELILFSKISFCMILSLTAHFECNIFLETIRQSASL